MRIWWSDAQAEASFQEALLHCSPTSKRDSVERQLTAYMEKIANYPVGNRQGVQNHHFPDEGDLPSYRGKPSKKFKAIKKKPVRIYGWFYQSTTHTEIKKGDFVISHCIHKDFNKLKSEDTQKVTNKWNILEVLL